MTNHVDTALMDTTNHHTRVDSTDQPRWTLDEITCLDPGATTTNPSVVVQLFRLSKVYRCRGDLPTAIVILRKALDCQKVLCEEKENNAHGADYSEAFLTLSDLYTDLGTCLRLQLGGAVQQSQDCIDEVKTLLNDALLIRQKALQFQIEHEIAHDENSIQNIKIGIANALSSLALFERAHGDANRAHKLHHHALSLFAEIPLEHDDEKWRFDSTSSSWFSGTIKDSQSDDFYQGDNSVSSGEASNSSDEETAHFERFVTVREKHHNKYSTAGSLLSLTENMASHTTDETTNGEGDDIVELSMKLEWEKLREKQKRRVLDRIKREWEGIKKAGASRPSRVQGVRNSQSGTLPLNHPMQFAGPQKRNRSRWFLSLCHEQAGKLDVRADPMVPRYIDLNCNEVDRIVIGRQDPKQHQPATNRECYVQLDSERHERLISRSHAELAFVPGNFDTTSDGRLDQSGFWMLKDLDSTNGVLLNGVRVKQVPIREGDVIVFGGASTVDFGCSVLTCRSKAVPSIFVYRMLRCDTPPSPSSLSSGLPSTQSFRGNDPLVVSDLTRHISALFQYIEHHAMTNSTTRLVSSIRESLREKGEPLAFLQFYLVWVSVQLQLGVSAPTLVGDEPPSEDTVEYFEKCSSLFEKASCSA